MRRVMFRLAVAALAGLTPSWALAEGAGVAQRVKMALKESGRLKNYSIDIKYDGSTAWLEGHVASADQAETAEEIAAEVEGVDEVINNLEVAKSSRSRKVTNLYHEQGDAYEPSVEQVSGEVEATPAISSRRGGRAPVLSNAVDRVTGNRGPRLIQTSESSEPALLDEETLQTDRQVAESVAKSFKGKLKGYAISVNVEQGVVTLSGRVRDERQLAHAVALASKQPGVVTVYNEMQVSANEPSREPAPFAAAPSQRASRQAAPARTASRKQEIIDGGMMPIEGSGMGAPLPMYSGAGGPAPMHYDSPNMPNHAWPSYAAYPNYGAVTYPRQYSPTAWPYIGPFYPYPQVPLGWRKVTLEWDDGWWFLDFQDR